MLGKTHSPETRLLIARPGASNPIYGRKHSEYTKGLISAKRNKYPNGVGIYNKKDILVETFVNSIELAKYFDSTVLQCVNI
jgi:hypothetical protein